MQNNQTRTRVDETTDDGDESGKDVLNYLSRASQ